MIKCEVCQKECKDLRSLKIHLTMSHIKKNEYESVEKYYLEHMNGEKGYCKVCQTATKFIGLENGYNISCSKKCSACLSSPNHIKCELCNNIFPNKISLTEHIVSKHLTTDIDSLLDYYIKYLNSDNKSTCSKCGEILFIKDLKDVPHCLKCDVKETCQICNKKINTSREFQYHINGHIKNGEIKNLESYYLKYMGTKPKCKCGKDLKFSGYLNNPYSEYCSVKCASIYTREKTKETWLKNYGVDNPQKSKEIQLKTQKTCQEKYGHKCVLESEMGKKKIKKSLLENYGVDNPFKSKEIQEKYKESMLDKHGVVHPMKSESIRKKMQVTIQDNYGVHNISQSDIIKEKIKKTNIEKLGVEYPTQSHEVREKCKVTCQNNYGVDNPMKNQVIVDKARWTKNKNARINYYERMIRICERKHVTPLFNKENYLDINNICFDFECDICKKRFSLSNIQVSMYPRCLECFPLNRSNFETEFNGWLSSIYEGDISINNREIIKPKEIDIYIPEHKLGIELNGDYWHSDKIMDKKYHINKTNDALNNGVSLIHILETEYINKSDIIHSMISNRLGLTHEKIFARKTIFKQLEYKEAKKFFDNNHIQGNIPAGIYFGLYYNDILVSALSFSKPKSRSIFGNRDQKSNTSELLRFCHKLNTNVVGGFSKLFKNAIKDVFFENIKEILTYANVRFSPDKNKIVYNSVGFEYINSTTPGYWYYYNGELYHRYTFRKSELIKLYHEKGLEIFEDDTEFTLADRLGMLRIYDCGNHKFIYKL